MNFSVAMGNGQHRVYRLWTKGDGIWYDGYYSGRHFAQKDIADVRLAICECGQWYWVAVELKNGKVIMADYTYYQSKAEAAREVQKWKEAFVKGE